MADCDFLRSIDQLKGNTIAPACREWPQRFNYVMLDQQAGDLFPDIATIVEARDSESTLSIAQPIPSKNYILNCHPRRDSTFCTHGQCNRPTGLTIRPVIF